MTLAEHNGFRLEYFDPADADEIGPLFFQSFGVYEFMRHMNPDTPIGREGWRDSTLAALKDTKYTIALKVVDPNNDNKLVAHGRWVRPKQPGETEQPGHEEGRWDDFMKGADEQLADEMFGAYDRQREALMGDKPHYCESLINHTGPHNSYQA